MDKTNIEQLSVNTIRTLSIDAIQHANSGHPGLPLGAAPMAYGLWYHHLKHSPKHPTWADRDRFVLSAGHGSMLLYSLLHLFGYDLTLDEIKRFRQWGSKTPGHPEHGWTVGVEATTGPLGQGAANAVGMAMAERSLAAMFNRDNYSIVDHYTYALVSDGDLMEGISAEAASLAGHLKLGKLIYLFDSNDVSLDGDTSLTWTEDVAARYRSYDWHVETVSDGDTDIKGIVDAIAQAKLEDTKPSLIIVRTTIGYGSPNKQGTSQSHGSPLGHEEIALTKQALGWNYTEPFYVPPEVTKHLSDPLAMRDYEQWNKLFEGYVQEYPDLAKQWEECFEKKLPQGWDDDLPTWDMGETIATRSASGLVQNAIAKTVPALIGGDADLSCSTKTAIVDATSFDGQEGIAGRNIHFGVREHAMGAIANGMEYHGGLRPFVSTFFCFSDYMRPSVRIAALNGQPIIYIWTHDSIGVGEDGPTHQPIEHLMSLRIMPHISVVRPADANEACFAWRYAMNNTSGPTALVLTRQNLPVLSDDKDYAKGLYQGAYILWESTPNKTPDVILMASGSEVSLIMAAAKQLSQENIVTRVVSMPCWEVFEAQDEAYRHHVFPVKVRGRVAVESGVSLGWERWTGTDGKIIGIDQFGASAPGDTLFTHYGFTQERIVETAKAVYGQCSATCCD